jgi:hypothetical protein
MSEQTDAPIEEYRATLGITFWGKDPQQLQHKMDAISNSVQDARSHSSISFLAGGKDVHELPDTPPSEPPVADAPDAA